MTDVWRICGGAIRLLAVLSGATALAHQVLWTRRMVDLLGASAGATARVFGCFFLGLALGAILGATVAARTRRPWKWLGVAECAVAVLCLPIVFLPYWADNLWPWLGPDRLMAWPGAALKTILSISLVLPPSLLMGIFIPVAVAGWPRPPSPHAARPDPGLWLYALNTLGAVAGIAAVALWMLPRWGMAGSMLAALALNGVAASICFVLDRMVFTPLPCVRSSNRVRLAGFPAPRFLLVAAVSGTLIMGTEVVALMMVQLVAPLSFFAPSAVLAAFILLLALAAFAVAARRKRRDSGEILLSAIAIGSGVALTIAPLLFHGLAPYYHLAVEQPSLAHFLGRLTLFTLFVFGLPIGLAGLWFPLMAALSGESTVPDEARLRWGWLLAANGIGGWLGAEIAYTVLLPAFGPFVSLGLLGLVYVVAGWVLAPQRPSRIHAWMIRGAFGVVFLLVGLWLPGLPSVHPQWAGHVLDQSHGREGSLVVIEDQRMGRALLLHNQYVLGSTQATDEQERQAHIPLLLHPEPRRVAFIGLATGITAGGSLSHSPVTEVHVVEIAENVARAARIWFSEFNHNVMTNPRASVVVEDGRTWLAAHHNAFDVIVSDLFLPWGPGEGRLYSVEHFSAARRALRDGGLFALWLPMYQLTEEQFEVILNTFLQLFPEVDVFIRNENAVAPALALIGWKNGSLDWNVVQGRLRDHVHDAHGFKNLDMPSFRSLYLARVDRAAPGALINTLGNIWVEWHAGHMRALQPESAPYLRDMVWREWTTKRFVRAHADH